jgi:hypothetical protein
MSEYKGKPVFALWKVDQEGSKTGQVPWMSFGVGKAKALLENLEAIKKFVQEHGGNESEG